MTAKDKSRIHQFGQETVKGILLAYVLRAGWGWSGDLIITDDEDLQESETSHINVKRFQDREGFAEGEHEFLRATGNFETFNRPRPSSTAESRKMMMKSKKATRRENKTEVSWSLFIESMNNFL